MDKKELTKQWTLVMAGILAYLSLPFDKQHDVESLVNQILLGDLTDDEYDKKKI